MTASSTTNVVDNVDGTDVFIDDDEQDADDFFVDDDGPQKKTCNMVLSTSNISWADQPVK